MRSNNSTAQDYYGSIEGDNTITYEFKPELIIYDNSSNASINAFSNNSDYSPNKDDNIIYRLLDKCQIKYKDLFYNTIMNEYIEEGYVSTSQNLYRVISTEFGNVVSSLFMSSIYIKYARNDKLVKSLLYIMAELKPNQLNGIEAGITAFALANKDYEIRDLALQCFEKWKDINYLDFLGGLSMDVPYLDEYLKYIINMLEIKRVN